MDAEPAIRAAGPARVNGAPAYAGMMDPPLRRCPVCDGAWRPAGAKRDRLSGARYAYTRCTSCGFLAVNPRPSPSGLAEFYRTGAWSIVGGTVDPREEHLDPARFVPWALAHVQSAGRSMLDIGAGTGCYTRAAIALGLTVTAVEPDARAADVLRARFGIPVVSARFEEFPADARFDVVLSNQVMGHVHDPVDWARRIARCTAPGGVAALGVLHAAGFWQRSVGLRDPYAKPPLHLNHFTARSLRALVERFGLQTCALRTYSRFPWALLSRKAHAPQSMRPAIDWIFRHAQQPPLAVLDRLGFGIFLEIVARQPMTST